MSELTDAPQEPGLAARTCDGCGGLPQSRRIAASAVRAVPSERSAVPGRVRLDHDLWPSEHLDEADPRRSCRPRPRGRAVGAGRDAAGSSRPGARARDRRRRRQCGVHDDGAQRGPRTRRALGRARAHCVGHPAQRPGPRDRGRPGARAPGTGQRAGHAARDRRDAAGVRRRPAQGARDARDEQLPRGPHHGFRPGGGARRERSLPHPRRPAPRARRPSRHRPRAAPARRPTSPTCSTSTATATASTAPPRTRSSSPPRAPTPTRAPRRHRSAPSPPGSRRRLRRAAAPC